MIADSIRAAFERHFSVEAVLTRAGFERLNPDFAGDTWILRSAVGGVHAMAKVLNGGTKARVQSIGLRVPGACRWDSKARSYVCVTQAMSAFQLFEVLVADRNPERAIRLALRTPEIKAEIRGTTGGLVDV